MVKSGLEQQPARQREPRVSPYRLAAHLSMALGLYSGLMWQGWTALRPARMLANPPLRGPALFVAHVVGVTVLSGVLVAGNDAGRAVGGLLPAARRPR
jgi:cytochrome c oxidase assembly protein subunit 15